MRMKLCFITALLLSACDGQPPAGPSPDASVLDSFRCATAWESPEDGEMRVYLKGFTWNDGTALIHAELEYRGQSNTVRAYTTHIDGITQPVYIPVAGAHWHVSWERAQYPVVDVRQDTGWGHYMAGLCGDHVPDRGPIL